MAYDKKIHGVVNVARHEGTINGTAHTQVMVYDTGANAGNKVDCDNGTLVTLGNYMSLDTTIEPNYEVYRGGLSTIKTSRDVKNLVIVASPEMIYDETYHYGLENFYNEAGKPVRAYFLKNNSMLSLSKEAFSNPTDVAVGKYVYLSGTSKLTAGGNEQDSYKIGYIESSYIYDYITMYNVRFITDVD